MTAGPDRASLRRASDPGGGIRKWLLIAGGVLAGVVLVVLVAGASMPREHVASSSIILHQPPDSVWAVIRDFASVPEWWPAIESSERADDPQGGERWSQRMDGSPLPVVVAEEEPLRRLVTRVDVPDDAAFGGTWTYEVEPVKRGSRVTVTETGFINNLFFRFMSNVVFGVHGTMDGYLRALGARFGEEVTPVHGEAT